MRCVPAAVLAAAVFLAAAPASAGTPAVAEASMLAQRGDSVAVSLDEAIARVVRRTGGEVLSARTVRKGGRIVHRIRVLVDPGRVRVYEVDAATGAVN